MLIGLLPWLAFAVVTALVFYAGRWLIIIPAEKANGHVAGQRHPQTLVFGPLTGPLAAIIPVSAASAVKLDRDLRRAGHYKRRARDEYLALRNVLMVGTVLLTAAWVVATADMGQRMTMKIVAAGTVLTIILFAVPRLYLQWKGRHRVQQIQIGLPDALDILTMCLTGGLPLQSALNRVNGQLHAVHPELADELDILRRQSDAGSLEQALEQFAFRVDAPEIRTLTSLVGHAERLGTNVSFVIREYADGLRRAHRQRAEERGNKMTIQMLFPIALCLAPASYILLLGPPVIEMRDFILRENRSGGILSPGDLSQPITAPPRAPGTTSPGPAVMINPT